MERFIMNKLIKWKNSKSRKPLILKGARQVGKTYILKQFGKENYEVSEDVKAISDKIVNKTGYNQ